MLESMGEWMSFPLYYAYDGATPPARTGAAHATIYPYGPFEAGDGSVVMVGLQNEREWAVFCDKVLEKPELKSDERFSSATRRSEARQALHQIIVEAFAGLTGDEVFARLDEAKIGNSSMNDMQHVWNHKQLAARNRWTEVDTPVGKVKAMMPPGVPESFEPRMDAIPGIGEHTDAILAELGYSSEQIKQFHDGKVV